MVTVTEWHNIYNGEGDQLIMVEQKKDRLPIYYPLSKRCKFCDFEVFHGDKYEKKKITNHFERSKRHHDNVMRIMGRRLYE